MVKVPKNALFTKEILGGIPEKYQKTTTSAVHRKYIATIYNMCMHVVAVQAGCDRAGAWT